jgi:CBS domain-containing protein
MNPIETILELKGHHVYVVSPDETVLGAVEAMCMAKVGSLVVMEGRELVGIFAERDLMTRVVLARRDPSTTKVGDVMTREVVCIASDVSPQAAMAIITDRRLRHLPVIGERGIEGLVSIGDLVRWSLTCKDREIGELTEYVAGRYPG